MAELCRSLKTVAQMIVGKVALVLVVVMPRRCESYSMVVRHLSE